MLVHVPQHPNREIDNIYPRVKGEELFPIIPGGYSFEGVIHCPTKAVMAYDEYTLSDTLELDRVGLDELIAMVQQHPGKFSRDHAYIATKQFKWLNHVTLVYPCLEHSGKVGLESRPSRSWGGDTNFYHFVFKKRAQK